MHNYEHVWGEWCYQFGPHLLCVVYRRSWKKPWRKRHVIRCYECDVLIEEPELEKV